MHQYEIPNNSRRCSVSGRELQPGEAYFSAVIDTVTGLVRRDYAPEHWEGPPADAVASWQGRLPQDNRPPEPKRFIGMFSHFSTDGSAGKKQAAAE